MQIRVRASLFTAFFILLCALPCRAWDGTVIGVQQGDAMTVMHGGRRVEVRLYGIFVPRGNPPFTDKARQLSSRLVQGIRVEVSPVTEDRDGNMVAVVYTTGSTCLNGALVGAGLARVDRNRCGRAKCLEWLDLEAGARKNRIGLWEQRRTAPAGKSVR